MLQPIGIIGVGLLGTAVAQRFIAGGYAVFAYDASEERRAALANFGGQSADRLTDVFARCRHVLLSLPTSEVVRQVLAEARECLQPGTIVIDTTTGSPHDAEEAAVAMASHAVTYLEATVAGSSEQVRLGEAVLMIGGEPGAWRSVESLLNCVSHRAYYLGPAGSAARMKLVVNLVLGLNRLVLAEGLHLARCCGMDLEQVLEVLRASPAYSTVMDTKGAKMIHGDTTPQARLAQHRKDVGLILSLGADHQAQLPLSRLHIGVLDQAIAMGLGDLDNSAVIQVLDAQSRNPT